jgi:hypothetical protein
MAAHSELFQPEIDVKIYKIAASDTTIIYRNFGPENTISCGVSSDLTKHIGLLGWKPGQRPFARSKSAKLRIFAARIGMPKQPCALPRIRVKTRIFNQKPANIQLLSIPLASRLCKSTTGIFDGWVRTFLVGNRPFSGGCN